MRRKKIWLTALLLVMCFLTGCEDSEVDTETVISVIDNNVSKGGSLVTVFYAENGKVIPEKESYQLKQPDSLTASFEEVMTQLHLPDSLRYSGYEIDEKGNTKINFECASPDIMTKEERLLHDAAFVSTLVQIKQIGKICIILHYGDGTTDVTEYDDDSFFFYDEAQPSNLAVGRVTLYLPSSDGGLSESTMTLSFEQGESMERKVVEQLIQRSALPEAAEDFSVSVVSGVAYVDFADVSLSKNQVYSIVNSLAGLPHIEKVQLLIAGNVTEMIGEVPTGEPLSFYEYNKEEE